MNAVNKGIEIVYKRYDTKVFKLKQMELERVPSLCTTGSIGKEFFKQSLSNADAYVIAHDVYKNGLRGSIRGFACLKFDVYPDFVSCTSNVQASAFRPPNLRAENGP